MLEHIPDSETTAFLKDSAECVAPGGLLLISVPTTNVRLTQKHFRHYDRDMLTRQLAGALPDFAVESMDYYYVPTLVEKIYKKIARSLLENGDIRGLRGFVWRHVKKRAGRATDDNGTHLIARLRRQ